jgi:ABC-type nitrate/sulfonate/bicarbonate transport system substrate-binding protein
VPTREFRVDDYGAPRYPELVLVTSAERLEEDPELVAGFLDAVEEGIKTVPEDPDGALSELLEAVPELSEPEQRAQLDALLAGDAIPASVELDARALKAWARWDLQHGILTRPLDVGIAFGLH